MEDNNSNIKDDIHLFYEIKKSDQKSFEELFNRYYNLLCNYSTSIVDSTSCAEELVADVFANLWIKRKQIKINKNVKAYLFRSTRNASISFLRKQKVNIELIDEDQINIPNSKISPDNKLIKEEADIKLQNLLNQIPARSREVFILQRFNRLKYSDIAEALDISVKTVEKHMSKSLKIIRDKYKFF